MNSLNSYWGKSPMGMNNIWFNILQYFNRYSACQIIPFFFYLLMIELTLIFYDLDTRAVALDKLPQGHNRPISPGLELVYCNYWGKGVVR